MLDLLLISGIKSFINQPDKSFSRRSFPVASLYDSLKDIIKVKIYVPEIYENNYDNLPEATYYGLSLYHGETEEAKKIIDIIRLKCPNAIVFCGGSYPVTDPEYVFETTGVEFMIFGDGIKPVRDILIDHQDYETHPNTYTKTHSGVSARVNPDLPYSYWIDEPEAFIDYDLYKDVALQANGETSYLLMTGQGCPFDCNFCCNKAIYGTIITHRSLIGIENDIAKIFKNPIVKWLFFTIPTVNTVTQKNYDHLEEIFKLLIKYGFDKKQTKAILLIRASLVNDRFLDLLTKYSPYLNYHLLVGIENFTDEGLTSMNKSENRQSRYDMFQKIKDKPAGIVEISGNVLFGFPGDTDEILEENIKSTLEIGKMFEDTDILVRIHGVQLQLYHNCNFYLNADKYPDLYVINTIHENIVENLDNMTFGITKDWSEIAKRRKDRFNEIVHPYKD